MYCVDVCVHVCVYMQTSDGTYIHIEKWNPGTDQDML